MQGRVYRYTGGEANPLALWQSLGLPGDIWWYGWSETCLYLPNRLSGSLPEADWERLSLFCEQAELRLIAGGGKPFFLLLTESDLTASNWELCGEYHAVESRHILLGDPPQSAGGATTTLVDVAYPTTFDYGIPLALSAKNTSKVVAVVRRYYDTSMRLRYTRYTAIQKEEFAR
ncbi:hypothetical protein GBSOP10_10746 [Armatimonadetes bacterium GBS]|nr:MAG: hypothetical protein KatS3mg021_2143 [Fimbriimonadales bacterium]CUU10632.1 hypothetical protein GBSOP10_10746 [Armatimonadetes bacterium GBS]CUU34125.1 hypothetical protein GXSOP10_1116 [Armatimonadetes bacterium GXS]